MKKATIGSTINGRRLLARDFRYSGKHKVVIWQYQCVNCSTVSKGSLQNLKVISCMYCKRLRTKNAMMEALRDMPLTTPMNKWPKIIKAKQQVSTSITPSTQELEAIEG